WRLDETSGITAADASGHGRAGQYQGGVTLGVPGLLVNDADTAVRLARLSAPYIWTPGGYAPFVNGGRVTIEGIAAVDPAGVSVTLFSSVGTTNPRLTLSGFSIPSVTWDPDGSAGGTAATFSGMWGNLPPYGVAKHWVLTFDEATDTAELYV